MAAVFCVGRNYAAHVSEMEGRVAPDVGPVFFLKPEQALLAPPGPVRFPPGAGEIHHEVELVVRVGRGASAEAVALGLDLTDRTRQAEAKRRGRPWAAAKGFRGSAPIGPFAGVGEVPRLDRLRFSLSVNGEVRQVGDTSLLLRSVPDLLLSLDAWFGLETGDLVFTGTPEGVGPIRAGDLLVLAMEGVPALEAAFEVAG